MVTHRIGAWIFFHIFFSFDNYQSFRVRRFFGKPKKTDVFLKTEILVTRCYFWRKTGKNLERMGGGGNEENRYFTKIEPYLYEFVANESSFGIIYSWKTKEILFEIWYRRLQNISLISFYSFMRAWSLEQISD